MPLQLIIGNKNYSSWSLRPWLAMKVAGIAFEETLISLDAPDFKAQVKALSGAGKVPVLIDGDTHVSGNRSRSLNIWPRNFPALWPKHERARAHARAIAAEMHAGFLPLRRHLPMNIRRPRQAARLSIKGRRRMPRASTPYGTSAARNLAAAVRFFTAHSVRPTPCMRRSSGVFTPTRSR